MKRTRILELQSARRVQRLAAALDPTHDETSVYQALARSLSDYRKTAFRRMTRSEKLQHFDKTQLENFVDDARADLETLGTIIHELAEEIAEVYNGVQDFGTSIRNRTQAYGAILSDLKILDGRGESETIFRDQLTDYGMLDVPEMTGIQAGVSTSEGICHLAIVSNRSLNPEISDIRISGNGTAGNGNIARILQAPVGLAGMESLIGFESELDMHADPTSLLDGEAQTWYEYQWLGTDRTDLIPAATARKSGELLSLKIQILFKSQIEFNWLDILPYLPEGMTEPIHVYSIRVTTDGVTYKPLYKDTEVMDNPLYSISQRYSLMTSDEALVRYSSQGVFLCPKTKATGIEIILRQPCAYSETLAAYQYDWTVEKDGKILTRVQQSEDQVPDTIRKGIPGKYTL